MPLVKLSIFVAVYGAIAVFVWIDPVRSRLCLSLLYMRETGSIGWIFQHLSPHPV
ncbi:MAG: hypothetical protein H7Z11_02550 [Verrucomicrobia bacterium]|nr:hypothetical protein [Leptolyngbya sp. ES-bin-22]